MFKKLYHIINETANIIFIAGIFSACYFFPKFGAAFNEAELEILATAIINKSENK